jgi:hypothetical protein
MVNLEVVAKFQKQHKHSDINGVIRTMYPNIKITLRKTSYKRRDTHEV